ncbi:SHOCT domain-containing protein [Desulfacinum infernum]|nr:SHOCT domain-containing protein [Desulfacinum infernum]
MEETERQDSRDFARKLRELEALRAEGILTQAEYENKRAQIMGERW